MDEAMVIEKLSRILELELAGVVCYTHYLKPITDMQALAHGGLPALAPSFFIMIAIILTINLSFYKFFAIKFQYLYKEVCA